MSSLAELDAATADANELSSAAAGATGAAAHERHFDPGSVDDDDDNQQLGDSMDRHSEEGEERSSPPSLHAEEPPAAPNPSISGSFPAAAHALPRSPEEEIAFLRQQLALSRKEIADLKARIETLEESDEDGDDGDEESNSDDGDEESNSDEDDDDKSDSDDDGEDDSDIVSFEILPELNPNCSCCPNMLDKLVTSNLLLDMMTNAYLNRDFDYAGFADTDSNQTPLITDLDCSVCQEIQRKLHESHQAHEDLKNEFDAVRASQDRNNFPEHYLAGPHAINWEGERIVVDMTVFDGIFDKPPTPIDDLLPLILGGVDGVANQSLEQLLDFYVRYLKSEADVDLDVIEACQWKICTSFQLLDWNWETLKTKNEDTKVPLPCHLQTIVSYLDWRIDPLRQTAAFLPADPDRMDQYQDDEPHDIRRILSVTDLSVRTFLQDHSFCNPCNYIDCGSDVEKKKKRKKKGEETVNDLWRPDCSACAAKRCHNMKARLLDLQVAFELAMERNGLKWTRFEPAALRLVVSHLQSRRRPLALTWASGDKRIAKKELEKTFRKLVLELLEKPMVISINADTDPVHDVLVENFVRGVAGEDVVKREPDKTLYFDKVKKQVLIMRDYEPETPFRESALSELTFTTWVGLGLGDDAIKFLACSAKLFVSGICTFLGKRYVFWILEMGIPLDEWIKNELPTMPYKEAMRCLYDLMRGLSSANVSLNSIWKVIHNDMKLSNVIVVAWQQDVSSLQINNEGKYELASLSSRIQTKFIDYGHSMCNLPSPFRNVSTPEFSSLYQLLGVRVINGINNDIFPLAYMFMAALSMGADIFSFSCPATLRPAFMEAIYDDDSTIRRRKVDSAYRQIVFTYEDSRRVLTQLKSACPELDGIADKLTDHLEFKKHVIRFNLRKGVELHRIRECKLFKSPSHAVEGLLGLMDLETPCLPEVFMQMLISEADVDKLNIEDDDDEEEDDTPK